MKKFLKAIWGFINSVLDYAIEENKNRLNMPPAIVAAIISGAVTIGSKIAADVKANKATKKLDSQAAEEKKDVSKEANKGLVVAKGVAKEGDPTQALKERQIKEAASLRKECTT